MPDLPDINPEQPVVPQPRSEPDTRPLPPAPARTRRSRAIPKLGARSADLLVTLINLAAGIVAVILALHIVFVIFTTNPGNPIVSTVGHWAEWLAWQFKDVFVPANHRVAVLVNYGLAALVYLVAARLLIGVIRRIVSLTTR